MNYQKEIADSVRARGYRDGWTDEQFAARQVAKLVEELGELCCYIDSNYGEMRTWEKRLIDASWYSRNEFDNSDCWGNARVVEVDKVAEELADILVVVYNLADAIGVDVNEMALEKATADIDRGVR